MLRFELCNEKTAREGAYSVCTMDMTVGFGDFDVYRFCSGCNACRDRCVGVCARRGQRLATCDQPRDDVGRRRALSAGGLPSDISDGVLNG